MRLRFLPSFFLTVLTAAAFVPGAAAYLTPEQVLVQQEFQYFFPAGNRRETKKNYEERNAERVENIREKQEENFGKKEAEEEHAAASEDFDPVPQPEEKTLTLDPRAIRLLERLTERLGPENLPAGMLHSGAPLTPTGPALTIAMVALLSAGIWTIRKARKLEK